MSFLVNVTALVAAQFVLARRCERVQSEEERDSAGADLEAQAQLVVLLVQGKEVDKSWSPISPLTSPKGAPRRAYSFDDFSGEAAKPKK